MDFQKKRKKQWGITHFNKKENFLFCIRMFLLYPLQPPRKKFAHMLPTSFLYMQVSKFLLTGFFVNLEACICHKINLSTIFAFLQLETTDFFLSVFQVEMPNRGRKFNIRSLGYHSGQSLQWPLTKRISRC